MTASSVGRQREWTPGQKRRDAEGGAGLEAHGSLLSLDPGTRPGREAGCGDIPIPQTWQLRLSEALRAAWIWE